MQKIIKAAKAAISARSIVNETHDKAGFTGTSYNGLSKPRNAGIAQAANTSTSKATARKFSQLTPRMLATLNELAKAYPGKAFPLAGIDRGQLAIFLNSGFIVSSDNTTGKLAGEAAKLGKPVAAKPAKPAKPAIAAKPESKPETPAQA